MIRVPAGTGTITVSPDDVLVVRVVSSAAYLGMLWTCAVVSETRVLEQDEKFSYRREQTKHLV